MRPRDLEYRRLVLHHEEATARAVAPCEDVRRREDGPDHLDGEVLRRMRPGMTTAVRQRAPIAPWIGLGAAAILIAAAITTPTIFGWNVYVAQVPPLLADWRPRLGPGTLPAVVIAVLVIAFGGRFAQGARWGLLLLTCFLAAVAWTVALATIDGLFGIEKVLENRGEYLLPARAVTDVGALLRGFTERIPLTAPDNWPVHVAGHPPGALLVFVLLVRIGLGTGLTAGLVVIVVAATTPVAVLVCLRVLGAEGVARRVAPFLAVGPAAIWAGVSADAMFAAPAAWGLCCLAIGATAGRRRTLVAGSVAAGLLLGFSVFLSWGLPLLGLLALGVLAAARSWRPLPLAVGAALVVALGFAAAGFAWWEAYPVLVERYWAGVATRRPGLYWIWANLAVLALSAGPAVGPAVAAAVSRVPGIRERTGDGVAVVLTVAAVGIIVAADLSGLSKSEVERIWQPFLPWLLVGTALLPLRWRRFGLAANVVTALLIAHLLNTAW